MLLDKPELRVEVLKFYQNLADREGSEKFSICKSLIDELDVTEIELGNAIEYLAGNGYIETKSIPGMNPAEGMSKITTKGIDHLESPPITSQQTPVVHNMVTVNGSVVHSQIAVGVNPSIEIKNSFYNIRQLQLTPEEEDIVTEMEKDAKSEHPSIDKIIEKGKSLWDKYGDSIKQEIYNIGLALLRSQLSL